MTGMVWTFLDSGWPFDSFPEYSFLLGNRMMIDDDAALANDWHEFMMRILSNFTWGCFKSFWHKK